MTDAKYKEVMLGLAEHAKIGGYCFCCPYQKEPFCHHKLCEDALALLKTWRPRVLTPSEVLEAEVVYAEDIDKAEIIPVLVNGRVHDRLSLIRAHLGDGQSHVFYPTIDDYGTRWRCWNERPSDVQREETAWK